MGGVRACQGSPGTRGETALPAEVGGGAHLVRAPPPVPRRSGSALHTDGAARVRAEQGAGAGPSHRNPQHGLGQRNGVPPPELKVPWAKRLPGKLVKLCFQSKAPGRPWKMSVRRDLCLPLDVAFPSTNIHGAPGAGNPWGLQGAADKVPALMALS